MCSAAMPTWRSPSDANEMFSEVWDVSLVTMSAHTDACCLSMLQLGGGSHPEQDGQASMNGSVRQGSALTPGNAQQQLPHIPDGSALPNAQAQTFGSPGGRPRAPLPQSIIYKMSCEYFSWPLLEPQV